VPASFDYAVFRIVPRVEREEFINAGVIVYCAEQRFLAARVYVDEARLKALWPDLDAEWAEAATHICTAAEVRLLGFYVASATHIYQPTVRAPVAA